MLVIGRGRNVSRAQAREVPVNVAVAQGKRAVQERRKGRPA